MTRLDKFRTLYRAHLRECPLPDGSPDRELPLSAAHWGDFERDGWVTPPDAVGLRRLTPEGVALAASVQLHAGRPGDRGLALARERAIARSRAEQAMRAIVVRYGRELAAEVSALVLGE